MLSNVIIENISTKCQHSLTEKDKLLFSTFFFIITDNDNNTMNKRVNFEDTIFILNVRMRMIRDLLQLDMDPGLFYSQTIGDLEFISNVLDILNRKFLENLKFLDREVEADNILDAEWQFSQIINELSGHSGPFSPSLYPEMPAILTKFRTDSTKRKKQIDDSYVPAETTISEPVVSHAELNGLLGSI
jgi:hypothetical protein